MIEPWNYYPYTKRGVSPPPGAALWLQLSWRFLGLRCVSGCSFCERKWVNLKMSMLTGLFSIK